MLPSYAETILACPETKAPLTRTEQGYSSGLRVYPAAGNSVDFFPQQPPAHLADRWTLWESLQESGHISYEMAPELNLSGGELASAFGAFLQLQGVVLDIGCGPQAGRPKYISPSASYIGLDPLKGTRQREFPFLHGIAEAMPVANTSVDTVVFCSSLDHMIDYRLALAEAARVLKPDGQLQMAVDVVDDHAAPQGRLLDIASRGIKQLWLAIRNYGPISGLRYVAAIASRGIPDGAKDHFHVEFPSVDDVQAELRKHGLEIERSQPHADMVFLSARRARP
jgi:SAM-dependent methyltransferase